VIKEIGNISKEDLPIKVETDAFVIEVLEPDPENLGGIIQSGVTEIVPDENEKIATIIEQKAGKCRNDRPLIVFIDLNIETVDCVEEVVEKVIGVPYGYARREDVEVSNFIRNTDNVWESYLAEMGAIPGESEQIYPAIPPGEEGIFASEKVSEIAGVMARFHTGEVVYVPNVYTNDGDAASVFDQLGWGSNTRTLKPTDI